MGSGLVPAAGLVQVDDGVRIDNAEGVGAARGDIYAAGGGGRGGEEDVLVFE